MAVDNEDIDAISYYANLLYLGKGIQVNLKEAAKYFKIAADKGDVNLIYQYGVMLMNGKGINVDYKEAAKYFKMELIKTMNHQNFITI